MKYIGKESIPAFRFMSTIPKSVANKAMEDLNLMSEMLQDERWINKKEIQEIVDRCLNEYLNYCKKPIVAKDLRSQLEIARDFLFKKNGKNNSYINGIKCENDYDKKREIRTAQMYQQDTWHWKQTLRQTTGIILQMTFESTALQGTFFPSVEIKNGEIISLLPKMVVISEEIYNDKKVQSSCLHVPYGNVFRLLQVGISYKCFVQTSAKIGRLMCVAERTEENCVYVGVMDFFNGCTMCSLELDSEGNLVLYLVMQCISRNLSVCSHSTQAKVAGEKNACECPNPIENCPRGIVQYALTVIRCLIDHLTKKNARASMITKAKAETVSGTDKYVAPDQIRIVDYYTDSEYKSFGEKFTVFSSGRTVAPHVRSSTMRHLKSGKVVPVRACIVHPEKFSGIESAERINGKRLP